MDALQLELENAETALLLATEEKDAAEDTMKTAMETHNSA